MGYTRYWTQQRDFQEDEFAEIGRDVGAILSCAAETASIAICNMAAEPNTRPEITPALIGLNGTDDGDLGHEGFVIERVRTPREGCAAPLGWNFCKTARKPYDRAVTAVLCYLATVVEAFDVTSDGRGADFLDGLELARAALPHQANRLAIPRSILAADRWCARPVRERPGRRKTCPPR